MTNQPTNPREALKPCPFCGQRPRPAEIAGIRCWNPNCPLRNLAFNRDDWNRREGAASVDRVETINKILVDHIQKIIDFGKQDVTLEVYKEIVHNESVDLFANDLAT